MTKQKVTHIARIAVLILFVLLAIIFPQIVKNTYVIHVLIIALIYSIIASSLNLVSGYTGLLSLGHQAFYGVGAYASALTMMRLGFPFVVSFLTAGLFSMISAWFIGKLTIRLRSSFFVIATVAFAKILELVCINWVSLTQGPMGLTAIPKPSIFGYEFSTTQSQYYLVLVVATLSVYICYRIVNSHIGLVFRSVADSEYLTRATGANVEHYLMLAITVGGFLAGLAGSLYAHYLSIISPDIFYFQQALNLVVMVIAGGLGTIAGPVIGAFTFTILPEGMRFSNEYRYLFYGIILALIIRFLPGGLYSLFRKRNHTDGIYGKYLRREE